MIIPPLGTRPTALMAPEGGRIYTYENHRLWVTAVDTLGERREADVELVSCDFELGGVDVILGYPWLSLVNPSISFIDGTWRHRIDGTKLEIMSAKKFARLVKTELYIYVLIVYPTTEARRLAALVMGSSITLPLKY
jgi:hypothetical protein